MPLVHLRKTEWWPVYVIYPKGEHDEYELTEIPQDLLDRWQAMKPMFTDLQDALAPFWDRGPGQPLA